MAPIDNTEASIPAQNVVVPEREQAIQEGTLILVAEDNETNQVVIEQQLATLGYACDVAVDGQQAYSRWLTGEYSLLLSDIHMPRMDGYELARAIRQEEARRGQGRTPILALTANVLKGEDQRCRAAGMDDYLAKPVPLSELNARLKPWLGDAGDAAMKQAQEAEMNDQLALFDPAVLGEMVGDNPAVRRRLLQKYLSNLAENGDALSRAHESVDMTEFARLSHSMKSASRSVGAMRLGELCEKMEHAAKVEDEALVKALFPAFESARELVTMAIEDYLSDG